MQKILVAYDGSEPANKAYEWGLDLAQRYRARTICSGDRLPIRTC
jgi:nucleotide-binding universal stress UspA family protein